MVSAQTSSDRRRYLGASEDDGLAQVVTHEGQGGGRVGHGVRAVKDHKAIVALVVFLPRQI